MTWHRLCVGYLLSGNSTLENKIVTYPTVASSLMMTNVLEFFSTDELGRGRIRIRFIRESPLEYLLLKGNNLDRLFVDLC
jgi:hypothetical protein